MPERHCPLRRQLPEPVVFLKPPSSLLAHGEPIVYPRQATRVEHEGELVAVMGRVARRVTPAEAPEAWPAGAAGTTSPNATCSARTSSGGGPRASTRSRPSGPYLETETPDPDAAIRCVRNGAVVQEGRVRDMLRDPFTLISVISEAMTLLPGDLIMLGTPPGVGEFGPGDRVDVDIEGVGRLANPVVAEG